MAGAWALETVKLGDEGQELALRVGKRVRAFRKRAGMSQIDLHERSAVSLAHISRIEQGVGNATLQTLSTLGRAMGCTLVDLVQDAEPEG